jgi:L-cysteine:1D-myo-inositol 2-amino-2-deoxy-alpha-D-glucopyranoside ligase
MRLYDTARQAVVDFEPGPCVLMYTCGITPYDATHLGHAFTFVTYDVLIRRLVDRGHEVRCVRNVTDLDDPLFAKARELGLPWHEIAAREERRLDQDLSALGVLPVSARPRVSEALDAIRELIAAALQAGYAYVSGGAVYFDIRRALALGELSHLPREMMLELARERGGHPDDPRKHDPLDFVMWQPSAADEPAFAAPWGAGRPGWHVGCSALALRELGRTVDLHGGGRDLIFPHHECERAQSEAVTGQPFVRHWMHAGLVAYQGHKMSKSLGNLVFVDRLRAHHDARAIRLALLAHHYRSDWEWYDEEIAQAEARLARWQACAVAVEPEALLGRVRGALDDDLDTPSALALIDEAAAAGHGVGAAARLLGVEGVGR